MVETTPVEFARSVIDLDDPHVRFAGGIVARDRQGQIRLHPPMRCSAAVLHLPSGTTSEAPERIGMLIAELKSRAKSSPSGLVFVRFDEEEPFADD